MTEDKTVPPDDLEPLRKAIHDLNNRVGVILTSAELLQLDAPEGKAKNRSAMIEQKAMEARQILSELSRRYFD